MTFCPFQNKTCLADCYFILRVKSEPISNSWNFEVGSYVIHTEMYSLNRGEINSHSQASLSSRQAIKCSAFYTYGESDSSNQEPRIMLFHAWAVSIFTFFKPFVKNEWEKISRVCNFVRGIRWKHGEQKHERKNYARCATVWRKYFWDCKEIKKYTRLRQQNWKSTSLSLFVLLYVTMERIMNPKFTMSRLQHRKAFEEKWLPDEYH